MAGTTITMYVTNTQGLSTKPEAKAYGKVDNQWEGGDKSMSHEQYTQWLLLPVGSNNSVAMTDSSGCPFAKYMHLSVGSINHKFPNIF